MDIPPDTIEYTPVTVGQLAGCDFFPEGITMMSVMQYPNDTTKVKIGYGKTGCGLLVDFDTRAEMAQRFWEMMTMIIQRHESRGRL